MSCMSSEIFDPLQRNIHLCQLTDKQKQQCVLTEKFRTFLTAILGVAFIGQKYISLNYIFLIDSFYKVLIIQNK